MKNRVKILNVVLLTAIYCFAISVVKPYSYADAQGNSTNSGEQYFSVLKTELFCHTSQSESSVNILNNLPSSCFKNPFNGIWAISKISEQLFGSTFAQYTTVSRSLLIHHRKTDMIFPFHYFW